MSNPLLHSNRPFRLPDFSAIRPEHVMPALERRLGDYERGLEERLGRQAPPGWDLVEAEAAWSDEVNRVWSPVSHLNSVADNEALREAYNEGLGRLTAHESWRQQHRELFRAYRHIRESAQYRELTPAQQRVVELELRDFELAGVALPEEQRALYRELVLRMSELGSKFSENLLDATRAWTLPIDDAKRLAGLPQTELNLLQAIAGAHGKSGWLVDLSAPSFQAIMNHARNRGLREKVYTAYVTRASERGPHAGQWDNTPLIEELLSLRHRLARLLGFENYVELALSRRMAETPRSVLEFLGTLADRAVPAARRQLDELTAFAKSEGAESPLQAWDIAYWSERYRQATLRLSDSELKPYLPLGRMLDALFYTAGRLFEVELQADESVPAWHPDVRFYWLMDKRGHRFAGLFMDLYARRDKRGGAWMDICLSRRRLEDGLQWPVAYLNCNFAPPGEDQPCLLTHDDLRTLFHEFGHCLHHLLTKIDWPQINGINNVEWDAVELPSQLLENWCWEDEILGRFARHHSTSEPMPVELRKRLRRSRYFQKAMFLVRQLEYALCDLRLHLEYNPEAPRPPLELLEEIRQQVCVTPVPEFSRFLNGFSHIFGGGYAAGYYSYLWAEQLAADAWIRFEEQGTLEPGTGRALKEEILAVGASRPALDSFVAFRGRPPEPGPLLKSYGLS